MAKLSKKTKRTLTTVLIAVAIGVVVVALIVVVYNLLQTREVRTTVTETQAASGVLVCEAKEPKDAFFEVENPVEVEHEIKVTYNGEDANTFFYTYDAEMANYNDATDGEAHIHADYNIYMADNVDDFKASFSAVEDEAKAQVYAEANDLGSKTATVFFISPEEFTQFDNGYEVEKLRSLYESKGFKCEYDD